MASFEDQYNLSKDMVLFFKEVTSLIDQQRLKVGQKYSWPEKYVMLYDSGEFNGVLSELLIGTPFSYTINGNTVEITPN